MPIVKGKPMSPDEAMLLGLCPECGAPVTPRTALNHARSHWNPAVIDPASEARRRYDLLAAFVQWGSVHPESRQRSVEPPPAALSLRKVQMSDGGTPEHDTRPFWIDQWIAGIIA